ncbi:MAG TPA: hypothetical protein EYH54_05615 [Nautiliaceae bacterium]|nr:hypothetical protein [Nautiliaceae bacterium]
MDKKAERKIDEILTTLPKFKEKENENFIKKILFSGNFFRITVILPLILITYYSFFGFNVFTWIIGFIWIVSLIIPLIFRKYELDALFINLILMLLILIFVFNFYPSLLYFILVAIVLFYFLYLAIKQSKTYFAGVVITFFSFLLVIKYSHLLIYPLPFVEKVAEKSSKTIGEAKKQASNSLIRSAEHLINKFKDEGKIAFLAITDPVEYQKMLEEREAEKNQLTTLGELSSFYFERIIINEPSVKKTINLGLRSRSNLILEFSYKIDKDLFNFIRLLNKENFTRFKIKQSCRILNDLKEISGYCLINGKEKIEEELKIEDLEKTIKLDTNIEIYSKKNYLYLLSEFEGLHISVGKINLDKIEALQLNTPLSIGLKFLNKLDENKIIGFVYFIDRLRKEKYLQNDPIQTENYLNLIKESYLCLSKVDNENKVNRFKVNNKEIKGSNLIDDYFFCYELVKNFTMKDPIKGFYIEIELEDSSFLRVYEWIFYIISKYEAVKLLELNVLSNNHLIPFFYLNKINKLNESSFLDGLSKLKNIEELNLDFNETLLDNFLEKLNVDFENFDEIMLLDENLDKGIVLKLLLASYLLKNYNFDKTGLCYLIKKHELNYDCSNFKLEDLINLISDQVSYTKNFLGEKYEKCKFTGTFKAKYDFKMFYNFLISKIENKQAYFCRDLERIYEEKYLEESIELIERIKDFNLASVGVSN